MRYSKNDIEEKVKYFQLPKFLFKSSLYKSLSNDAKVAYALLKDRLNVSQKNVWTNKEGEIYFIFSVSELAEELGVSKNTALKVKSELVAANLLEEEKRGKGRANHLYLHHPVLTDDDKYEDKDSSENKTAEKGSAKSEPVENKGISNIELVDDSSSENEPLFFGKVDQNLDIVAQDLDASNTNLVKPRDKREEENKTRVHESPFFKFLDTFKVFSVTDIYKIIFELDKTALKPSQEIITAQIESMKNKQIIAPATYFLNGVRDRVTAERLQKQSKQLPAIDLSYKFFVESDKVL
ncbi:replication initiator protein A [Enterococcus mediterraneensis]|uniref:replication initiator protein A n=1 Tax=Enterococcus mediterraneensis TaxID=2364791 RepID=UPI000F06ED51|nr:replication initiator protein A [Enterococcus mediterraneensis]